ncbi:AaceriAFR169Wp [[Ashbya] aceris (nom. inval.)]|nr:AaceriAFR169Wp [[Ashbya] aceris (nom. inval.)]
MSKWEQIEPVLDKSCYDSQLSVRTPALKSIRELLQGGHVKEKEQLNRISNCMLKTYALYQDAESKGLVRQIFEEILRIEPDSLHTYLKFISDEVGSKLGTKAFADYMSFLEWLHLFLVFTASSSAMFHEYAGPLVQLHCSVTSGIELGLDNQERGMRAASKQNQHRRRIRKTLMQSSTKALVKVLEADEEYKYTGIISEILVSQHARLKLNPCGVVILTGALVNSILRLLPRQPAHYTVFQESYVDKFGEYLSAEVLLGKNPPTVFCVEVALPTFLHEFVDTEFMVKYLVPSMEKCNLRSPEMSFGLAAEIYKLTNPNNVNLMSVFVSSKLMSQTFSAYKSTKEAVREAALQATHELLMSLNQDTCDQEALQKFVAEVFKNMKSNLHVDYKSIAARILSWVPTFSESVSSKILEGLHPYVIKESNETALSLMLEAFFTHLGAVSAPTDIYLASLANGFQEKKLPIRKLWLVSFLSNIDSMPAMVVERFEGPLIEFTKEALSKPLKIGSTSLVGVISFWCRVHELKLDQIEHKLLEVVQNASSEEFNSNCLGFTWIYTTMSRVLPAESRLKAVHVLEKLFPSYPALIGNAIIEAFKELFSNTSLTQAKESLSFRYSSPVFAALSREIANRDALEVVLVNMLIVTQCSELSIKQSWAELVMNAKFDPSQLVGKNAEQITEEANKILLDPLLHSTKLADAAANAVAYSTFINPDAMAPLLSNIIAHGLDDTQLARLSSTDIEIWRGQDDELVINVLEKSNNKPTLSKNSKDYETLKWEESIRKKQQNKPGSVKKLTKEEQILVNQQLEKEKSIRAHVNSCRLSIIRSIRLISVLTRDAAQINNGAGTWYPIAVNKLLDILQQEKFMEVVGSSGTETFLQLSNLVTNAMGTMKYMLGVAILRTCKITLPSDLQESPLSDLISTVLFKAKFASDKKPFDAISLAYILPLLIRVLEEGKRVAVLRADKPIGNTEFVEEDKEEEHLLLALEIISSHAEAFVDPSIPRGCIVGVLLMLLAVPSKAKLAKDCFMSLCRNISMSPSKDDIKLLLENLMSPNSFVRGTVLEALDDEYELHPFMTYSPELFICTQDEVTSNSEVAEFIWEFNNFKVTEDMLAELLKFYDQSDSGLRLFVAKAFTEAVSRLVQDDTDLFVRALTMLMDLYSAKARPAEAVLDEFGLVAVSAAEQKDPWQERSTIAITLKHMAPLFNDRCHVLTFVKFLAESGPLGDVNDLVRQEMKEAGIEVIKLHGAESIEELIPIFESSLSSASDITVKQNIIILYGSLARHLNVADPRVNIIVERLLVTLDTPSEDVQQAASACISPLVPLFKDRVGDYIETLFRKLFDSTLSDSTRRGAAWGIAGLVKGYGISALSKFDVIRNLAEASEDKKDAKRRESVAYAFECLSKSLDKFFEPYVIEVLPNILKNLGDSVPEVRSATAEATKSIMSHTTSYGVKKLIPVAISNLDDMSWRTKRGSVELLGNMAYLDPTQLSASLSIIVPEIVGVLNDSHKEVRKAADQALKRFGEVIRNPEIQKLVPTLIKAIGDPTAHTEAALDALIQTQFCHYIDGPSLALIIHVIHRGMRDRSANTKRKACKIVGNMAILVDTKDLVPYLQQLIDEVEVAMVDPVPQTRATAARALGALVERLGEDQFPDLIPRLLSTLSDDSKSGDRLGSAQALAEVISGLGLSKLDELLPTILNGVTSYRAYIREGFMPLLLFLPVCFGSQFAPYINQIVQPILSGLADSDENIRDVAFKAGKLIVKNYAKKAIDLLLPELERGMFDENERIRLSSVQLSGDLLFQVTGISAHNEFSEEDADVENELSGQMVEVLGEERRDRILSALFVCRNDSSGIVRATTIDIWKALVPNTPRTIKDILPTLTSLVVVHLASSSNTLRHIAAQSLGDLVRRVGGNALSQLLPTLEASLQTNSDPNSRQGICIALRELISSSNVDSLMEFEDTIVNILRNTLVDEYESVRESAALSFDTYQDAVGRGAIDKVIPYLLNILESSENSEYALLALQEIISTKSEVIFPILIPSLLAPPMDAFKARAMGSLAEVAGVALYKRLSTIINSLVNAMVDPEVDESAKESIINAIDKVLASVSSEDGVHPLLQQLMALLKNDNIEKRVVILGRLPTFFKNTVLDYSIYTADIVSQAVLSLDSDDERIVKGNFEMLSTLVKLQDKQMLERLVKPTLQALQLTGKPGEDLMAFSLPSGPNCILPIFLQGLVYGSNEDRESSALGIADIVSKTPAANLKPYVTVITGPLIRVVGERSSSDIKAAILYALNVLFSKVPQFLRPFIPQLQRTFVKSLSDSTNETLRLRAAKALGTLIQYQPRVDPLVVELVTGAQQASESGVRTAILKALLEVVSKAGSKLSEVSKANIIKLVEQEMASTDSKFAVAYAKLLGALSEIMSPEEARSILHEKVLESNFDDETGRFAVLTLNSILRDAPAHVFTDELNQYVDFLVAATDSSNSFISDNSIVAVGKLLLLNGEVKSPHSKMAAEEPFYLEEEQIGKLISQLARCMLQPRSSSLDTRRLALVVVRTLCRYQYTSCIAPHLTLLAASTFACLRDTVIPVKLSAEKAYLAMFRLVDEKDMDTFAAWSSGTLPDPLPTAVGTTIVLRSITDYTRRVGARLAKVERDRIAAGGDAETMFSDRYEDESEIWAVGGVDLNTDV